MLADGTPLAEVARLRGATGRSGRGGGGAAGTVRLAGGTDHALHDHLAAGGDAVWHRAADHDPNSIREDPGAGLRGWPDGTGDIALSLLPGERIAYLVLCPHARPWTFGRAQPSFRSIPDAAAVAQILGRALAASASQPARAVTAPVPAGSEDRAPVPAAA